MGKHEPELVSFVRAHRGRLDTIPSAFLSVCGAEAGFEAGPVELRPKAAAHVADQIRAFEDATGWHPAHIRPVAGAFVFTRYNPLVRWGMKQVARAEGLSTDTSRDHEYTDWLALDDFARRLAGELHDGPVWIAPAERARVTASGALRAPGRA
jgi:menaquinone-dependent protoporphyrinogen oxidase